MPSLSHRIRRRVARRAEQALDVLGLVEPRPPLGDDMAGQPLHTLPPAPALVPEPTPEPESPPEPTPSVELAEPEVEEAEPGEADARSGPLPMTMETVQEVFDDMVRPALQADGGDISLVKVEDGDVFVRLVGACSSCPSSTMTMRLGIERLLREEFPGFGDLIAVGDYEIVD